jgi:hypothetical protein
MTEFPPGPTGHMVSFATWEQFIRASDGSDAMKELVVKHIRETVCDGELLDSFHLGYALGALSSLMSRTALEDLYRTIKLTRNLDNVPIVQRHGQPVS